MSKARGPPVARVRSSWDRLSEAKSLSTANSPLIGRVPRFNTSDGCVVSGKDKLGAPKRIPLETIFSMATLKRLQVAVAIEPSFHYCMGPNDDGPKNVLISWRIRTRAELSAICLEGFETFGYECSWARGTLCSVACSMPLFAAAAPQGQ